VPAEPGGALDEAVPLDDGEHGGRDSRGKRIRHVGGEEQESPFVADAFDLVAGDDGRHGQARAESLRQRQQVGHDPVALERVHGSRAADAGLGLVDDQEHPAFDAEFLEPGQVSRWRLDDSARGQDGLDEARGEAARGLRVDDREAVLEFGSPVVAAVGVPERGSVRVRRREGQVARHGRTVAAASRAERRRRRARRHPMP
jgi:hypothetical protein